MTRTNQNHILSLSPKMGEALTKAWPSIEKITQEHGCLIKIVCSTRTQAEQDALWAQGRSKPGRRVTWTQHSKHQDGEAVDFGLFQNGFYLDENCPVEAYQIYEQMSHLLKPLGVKWLGPIGDDAHFELESH
jgi:peptidoglycan L-alanyl-D-glutamate endopeptidase CwlK